MAPSLAADSGIDHRLQLIADALGKNAEFAKKELPGFQSLLQDYLSPDIETDKYSLIRRVLKVFKDSSDNTYQDLLGNHADDEKKRLERFVDGATAEDCGKGFQMLPNLGTREEIQQLLSAPVVSDFGKMVGSQASQSGSGGCMPFGTLLARFMSLFHKTEKRPPLRTHKNAQFRNWGRTVDYKAALMCVPTTVLAVQQIVRYAKENNMGVRCSAYRHSWSPIFGRNGDITISMLQLKVATKLPNTAALPLPQDAPTELESIEFTNDAPLPNGQRLVRVGCATTNERLRRWCLDKKIVTLPLNVIMVETTLGGSTSAMCHGAGRAHKTISDLVRRVEYVDANGQLQTVTDKDPEFLKTAAGCFGLIGIVTHITLSFDPMTYAVMRPMKVPVIETIPPPPGMPFESIPAALRPEKPLTDEQNQKNQKDFEDRANNDYYAEWFWFPYMDKCWINTWNNTTDPSDVKPYPDDTAIFLAFAETFAVNVMQYTPVLAKLSDLVGMAEASTSIISFFGMMNFPEVKEGEKPIKTYLPEALHYQRAIQNVRVRELEVEMPLTAKAGEPNRIDYTNVQRAWWDAILKAYKYSDTCPQRMPLEMRIMGNSDMTLASQRGNKLGTCCIGVLTLEDAADLYPAYAQEVLDTWNSYKDAEGNKVPIRPHWAKEW